MPGELRYAPESLWLRRDGEDGACDVGITEAVSRILTWVHSVDLPPPGERLAAGAPLATIESQKARIELAAPVDLEVVEPNAELRADPMLVRMDPRGRGWLVRARVAPADWEALLEHDPFVAGAEAS